jgi:hypothetical protein
VLAETARVPVPCVNLSFFYTPYMLSLAIDSLLIWGLFDAELGERGAAPFHTYTWSIRVLWNFCWG